MHKTKRNIGANLLKRTAALLVFASMLATLITANQVQAAATGRQTMFTQAAAEFQVPEELLLAISYNQSRWENHHGQSSVAGGFGLMHLTAEPPKQDRRGDSARRTEASSASTHTLKQAANLIKSSEDSLKKDDRQNIRGSAALLADYAKSSNQGHLPQTIEAWYTAVARFSDAKDQAAAQAFADDVYATIQKGAQHTTTDGQTLRLAAKPTGQPDTSKLSTLNLPAGRRPERHSETECPRGLTCKFVPARFAQNKPEDPVDYGNYDTANRPHDMKIKYIMIHDMEGSYQSSIDWFQDPRSYVSAHYMIRSSDGEITQMVKTKDVAWHARNYYHNMHAIGIEHEGFAAEGATWFTEAMYRSSAKLTRYLAEKYNVPLDRDHVIGSDQNYSTAPARIPTMHWDPGPFWDWEHYMELLGAPPQEASGAHAKAVTIAPRFTYNKPSITQCEDGYIGCTPLPTQSANVVFVRTQPHHNAPLVTNIALHPDGAPGTNAIHDWSATAIYGQRFAVADKLGDWTAIWYGGQKGWIHTPTDWRKRTVLPAKATLITPKAGLSSIPLYGRPLPEPQAYTNNTPVQPLQPLQYTIPAGQTYPIQETNTVNDYYHVLTFDRSSPGDGTLVVGNEKYYAISYNHRQGFVKAGDVQLVP